MDTFTGLPISLAPLMLIFALVVGGLAFYFRDRRIAVPLLAVAVLVIGYAIVWTVTAPY